MKEGGVFLMDEISLADDSVLERLNRWGSRTSLWSRLYLDYLTVLLLLLFLLAVFWRQRSRWCWRRKAAETTTTWN